MPRYPEQGKVLILAMDVHQVFGQCAQQSEGYDPTVHAAGVAPLQVDLSSEDYLLFVDVDSVFIQNDVDSLTDVAGDQEDPSTLDWLAPERTMPTSERSPSSKPSASTMIDFPAPVSPVSTLKPGDSSISSCSMVAKLVMLSSLSMTMPGDPPSEQCSLVYPN